MTAPTSTPVAAPPAAVLWDMDGTLVDTEPYWMACEHELVAAHGGRWTDADARSIVGFDLLDGAAVLRERGGVDLDPHEIVERLLDGVVARVRERVPWRPGARRLLSQLNERGIPCALVTMSWRRLTDAVLEALEPITFQAVITGDSVRHGKPHPEPYLRAAHRLGVDPAECVAIEDSPTGIASASAAGCAVLAVPNIVPIEPGPDRIVVRSLRDVSTDDLGAYLAATPLRDAPAARRAGADGSPRRSVPGGRAGVLVAGLAAVVVAALVLVTRGGGDDAAPDVPPRPEGGLSVHAWTPYWAIDDALAELPARAGELHQLSPFWFRATGVDSIEVEANTPTDQAETFLDTARDLGVPLVASILDGTEANVMARILADPEQRSRHVDAIADFAGDGEFDGIDIDYEQFAFADGRSTWAATRPNWVAFIEELSGRLHEDGRTLTVSIPPVFDAGQTDASGYWVYDYAAITPLVDSIRIMAYDYSILSGEPGPIAPLAWVESVIAGTSAASGDPAKLVLGIPMYGYNWVVATSGTCPASAEGDISLSTREMAGLAARRGATPQFVPGDFEMAFTYDLEVTDGATTCTQRRDVRYMSGEGAQIRMQRAVDAGFGGVALFAFGYEDAATWNAVDAVSAPLRAAGAATSTAPPAAPAGG